MSNADLMKYNRMRQTEDLKHNQDSLYDDLRHMSHRDEELAFALDDLMHKTSR